MYHFKQILSPHMAFGLIFILATPIVAQHSEVLSKLNEHDTVIGSEDIKSFRVIVCSIQCKNISIFAASI